MHLGNLGEQVVLKTQKAFDAIAFERADYAIADEWYVKKAARDAAARDAYFSIERSSHKKGDLYIALILDEEMKADDERLQ